MLIYAVIQESLDMTIPGLAIDILPFSPETVSFFATITSIMGFCTFFLNTLTLSLETNSQGFI